jgi:hypothetical protein
MRSLECVEVNVGEFSARRDRKRRSPRDLLVIAPKEVFMVNLHFRQAYTLERIIHWISMILGVRRRTKV